MLMSMVKECSLIYGTVWVWLTNFDLIEE